MNDSSMFSSLVNSTLNSSNRKKSCNSENEHKYFSKLQEGYEEKQKLQKDIIYRLGLLILDAALGGLD